MILNFLRKKKIKENKRTLVSFTGGMGAQIISAAIYFQLRGEQKEVYADFSYFDEAPRIAEWGRRSRECSQWPWQLDSFGLKIGYFETNPVASGTEVKIVDGDTKLKLGIEALRQKRIKEKFLSTTDAQEMKLTRNLPKNYICIHMRRGDYLNVATHLISEQTFSNAVKKFLFLDLPLVVISDSPIPSEFKNEMLVLFRTCYFLDRIDEASAHCMMRKSKILFCSNSQFSLTAALLQTNGLALLPTIWFGTDSGKRLETVISDACSFQLFD